jgi:hypothetical protein
LSGLDHGHRIRPVLVEPRHRFRPVYAARECRERGVFERLLRKPVGGVVDQFMKAFVARALLQTISNPRAGRLGAAHPGSAP